CHHQRTQPEGCVSSSGHVIAATVTAWTRPSWGPATWTGRCCGRTRRCRSGPGGGRNGGMTCDLRLSDAKCDRSCPAKTSGSQYCPDPARTSATPLPFVLSLPDGEEGRTVPR